MHRVMCYACSTPPFVEEQDYKIMRTKVTENGVLMPNTWLEGVDEVDIQHTPDMILIVPVQTHDPILDLGKQPILLDLEDAFSNHDQYFYHQ